LKKEKMHQKKSKKVWKLACIALSLLVMATFFISSKKKEAEEAVPGKVEGEMVKGGDIAYGTWQSPDNLDSQVTILQVVLAMGSQIHDPLLRQRPGDSTIYPGLAESYEVSSDATEYTFFLRKDVKFHDGTPFNAQAVKFSLDRIVDPETRSAAALGAVGPYESSDVIDDYTVKVKFKEPFAGFLNMVCTAYVPILSPTAVKKWGDQYQFHVTGTGPFKLKEYVPDDHVSLVRFEEYNWGPEWDHEGPAYVESLTYTIIPEDLTRISTLKTGETNIVDSVRSHDIPDIEKDPNLKLAITPVAGAPWILLLNYQKFPTSEKAVRVAVEYAIDRETMCDLLYKGTNEPHYSPIEKNTLGYDPEIDKIYRYDPEKAKQILEEAGWKAGPDGIRVKGGKRLSLNWGIWPGGGMDEPASVVQDQLRQIGMEVVIESADVGTTFGKWNTTDALNIAMPFYVWADPMFMGAWYGSRYIGSTNWAHVKNRDLDRMLSEAEKTPDPKVRAAAYKKAQRWLMEEGVTVPLFGKSLALGLSKKIEGIEYEITGLPLFFEAHFVE
jgi:peptide/nickel transport system substrate-binding protein